MSKPPVQDARFDFRKGRNTAISPDLLNSDELVDATNARLTASYGGFTKRSGCQRIHQTAVGSGNPIRGLVQWDGPSGKQVVAISNGRLYYRNGFTYSGAFTETIPVAGDEFSTTEPSFFAPFRAATSGAPLILYIASAGKFYTWTGAVLTRIDGATPVLPPDADMVISYHTRLFVHDTNFKKHLFWSKIGDGTSYVTGTKTDGGSALVDVLNGEEMVALEVIGSSLLIATEDCIMRFTGHATDDIIIAQDTEGVSSEVGVIGKLALKRFENVAAFLSERGPYVATETNVEPIAEQIGPDFAVLDITNVNKAIVGWNRGRKELLYCVPGASDGGANKTMFVQASRLQAWYGPWTYSFGVTYLNRYETSTGAESVITGSSDGFIRDMDVGSLDDVLYDGSGGTSISMSVTLPPIQFGLPGITKALYGMNLQANLPTGSDLRLQHTFDDGATQEESIASLGTGVKNYRIDLDNQGKRLELTFNDASPVLVTIAGYILEGWNYARR